jgi:ribosomal protein S18 acetylase RimI-like enzyme
MIEVQTIPAELPAVPGLRFRRFAGAEDFPGMAAANMAARIAADVEEMVTAELMANDYGNLTNSDLDRDLAIVELDGRTVGYVRVEWLDQNDGSRSYDRICILEPGHRGHGIGAAMLRWAEARIREIAAGHDGEVGDRPRWFGAENWDADVRGQRLLIASGYTPVRTFFDMVRPDLDDLPDAALPEGFDIRPIGFGDLRTVWEADAKAFRDHWGGVDMSEESYERFAGDPRLDPSLHVVAFAGDEVAGAVLNIIDDTENEQFDRRRGLLDSVFVRRPYRRRGLARALIVASLRLLRERGMTSAWLGVDADNENAALALYESCGFRVTRSTSAYRKPLENRQEVP